MNKQTAHATFALILQAINSPFLLIPISLYLERISMIWSSNYILSSYEITRIDWVMGRAVQDLICKSKVTSLIIQTMLRVRKLWLFHKERV